MKRPSFVTDDHLTYLDGLRESGVTNMYGATPYIQSEYPELTKEQTKGLLMYWLKTFGQNNR